MGEAEVLMRKSILVFSISGLLVLVGVSQGFADPIKRLSSRLTRKLDSRHAIKISILSFPYINGGVSSGSSIVSERLTTRLAQLKKVEVVERRLLQKILEEKRLSETGIIDPVVAKELGTVLGVDAIVTGTLTDFNSGKTEINARMINAVTGDILSAGLVTIQRDWPDKPIIPAAPYRSMREGLPDMGGGKSAIPSPMPEQVNKVSSGGKKEGEMRLSNDNFPKSRRDAHPYTLPQDPRHRRSDHYDESDDEPEYYEEDLDAQLDPPREPRVRPYLRPSPSFIDKRIEDTNINMNRHMSGEKFLNISEKH